MSARTRTANINPITTTVVALAAGNSDVSALFTNLKTSELTTISTNYAAKAALVTASLQAALPTGVKSEDYFTGTITAGKGMDAVFDTYQFAINTAGITVKTKDASATTVLTIPAATVTANTTQALPTITVPTSTTTDVTGTWSGTITLTLQGGASGSTTQAYVLKQTGSTVTGTSQFNGAAGNPAVTISTATLTGNTLAITSFPANNTSDDCNLYSKTFTYNVAGSTLTLTAASGTMCTGNNAGGHTALTTITGGSGTLSKN